MAWERASLLGVPVDDDKNSIIGVRVALPAAFWKAYDKVH
jgi:hypothetical protein